MQGALIVYFDGEKNAGLFLAGLGAVGIAVALLFLRERYDLRSFAVTLGVLALAEIALGVGLYVRTDPQMRGLLVELGSAPARFHAGEDTRMVRVQRNFIGIEYVEVAVIVLSALVALTLKSRPVPTGIALGLLIHAAVLLAFDLLAERRGAVYLAAIRAASAEAAP